MGEEAGSGLEGAAAGGDSSTDGIAAEERCLRLVGALGAGGTAGGKVVGEGADVGL